MWLNLNPGWNVMWELVIQRINLLTLFYIVHCMSIYLSNYHGKQQLTFPDVFQIYIPPHIYPSSTLSFIYFSCINNYCQFHHIPHRHIIPLSSSSEQSYNQIKVVSHLYPISINTELSKFKSYPLKWSNIDPRYFPDRISLT